jgi:hypothetical protein
MRLPLVTTALLLATTLLGAGPARADMSPNESAKPLESGLRHAKKTQVYAAPLFVEQKETPGASKTALRLGGAWRLSDKSKD